MLALALCVSMGIRLMLSGKLRKDAKQKGFGMKRSERPYRLQVELSEDDKKAIEDFWFRERLPTRAAAVRELLRRAIAQYREEISN
ncbi:hypothetical protein ACVWY5_005351 [Bradyrhizobium sp. USDA 3256]